MKGVTYQVPSKGQKHSYASDLPDSSLNLTYSVTLYTVIDDPRHVKERANCLSKVAYEKGDEVHPDVGASERRFVKRMTNPNCGHLRMNG